jgi:ferredoxin-NADP reductase
VVPGAGPNGRDLRRAYSIASHPEGRPVELCVKLVDSGPGSNYLNKLRNGDTFRGYAPYGDFTYESPSSKHVCFIATGTGIAPFRSMMLSAEYAANPPKSATCLLGVRDEAELLYESDITLHGKWIACVSQPKAGWKGFKGRVTDYLKSLGEEFPWQETEYYLCGAGQMIDEVRAILTERGVAKEAIHREIYFKQPKPTT